jgi:regulator of replication initiation timing
LSWSNFQKSKHLDKSYTEINEAHTLNAELETSYNNAIAELDGLKGTSAEMNELIEKQQAELEEQKNKIAALLKDSRNLAQARKEIANMKTQMEGYVAEIEALKAQNMELTGTNQQLTVEKQDLFNSLQSKEMENTQLNEAKVMLVSQNEELSRSVRIGSVIKVQDVRVEGLKITSNGKVKGRKSAKKVDQLKICFTTTTNEVVHPGVEQFFVRIINPRGETLAVEDLGSGTVIHEKTGEEVRFTQFAETEYANDEQNLCLLWNPDTPFDSGKYAIEIYNKGYLAGTGSFEVK